MEILIIFLLCVVIGILIWHVFFKKNECACPSSEQYTHEFYDEEVQTSSGGGGSPPVPLNGKGQQVDWWLALKYKYADKGVVDPCGSVHLTCPFGTSADGVKGARSTGFLYADSTGVPLQAYDKLDYSCLGQSKDNDPLGETFNQVTNKYNYVIWNDQFYKDPIITKTGTWGHSKGLMCWTEGGDGIVLQVTTPDWPRAAADATSTKLNRGNSLGCTTDDSTKISQQFFCARLSQADLQQLTARILVPARLVMDITIPQIANLGSDSVSDAWRVKYKSGYGDAIVVHAGSTKNCRRWSYEQGACSSLAVRRLRITKKTGRCELLGTPRDPF